MAALGVSGKAIVGDRLPRRGVVHELADAPPDSRIVVERAHPDADRIGVTGIAAEERRAADRRRNHFSPPPSGFQRGTVRRPDRLRARALGPVGDRLREHRMGHGPGRGGRRGEPAAVAPRRRPQRPARSCPGRFPCGSEGPCPATTTVFLSDDAVRMEAVGRGPAHVAARGVRAGPARSGHRGREGTLHFPTSPLRYGRSRSSCALCRVAAMGTCCRSRRRPDEPWPAAGAPVIVGLLLAGGLADRPAGPRRRRGSRLPAGPAPPPRRPRRPRGTAPAPTPGRRPGGRHGRGRQRGPRRALRGG